MGRHMTGLDDGSEGSGRSSAGPTALGPFSWLADARPSIWVASHPDRDLTLNLSWPILGNSVEAGQHLASADMAHVLTPTTTWRKIE
jgi:hypothetical protein